VAHVLIIEDDPRLRAALTRSLVEHGHAVSSSTAGMTGLEQAMQEKPDLVVLDLGLPDLDGVEVLRMLRAVSRVPIVVATARDDERQTVAALHEGADDYLVKPFGAAQLDARIRAVLRRVGGPEPQRTVKVGELEIDPRSREVTVAEEPVELSRKEFDLLWYLAERKGVVVSRRELMAEIWRLPYSGSDKTLDVHLSWLRRKLGETAQKPVYLHTVRGVGVRLAAPEGQG
jgi:DNA-binding response OmpR family regulator